MPWDLLIGPSQSGKTTLLRAVASSFPPSEDPTLSADAPTQNCDWWFFNTAIVLDTAGSYALPTKGERDSTQWFRFLQLLRYYRELLPINGLIVAIGADMLTAKREEDLRLEAGELRKRIDEAIRELGVDFPIYLLITRCDLIEGFTEFFGYLPESVQKQAFGYMRETRPGADQQPSGATAVQRLESVHEKTVERLRQLRLSIFNAEKLPPATLRQKIYCFPEEFRALLQSLSVFVEALVVENPFQHPPFFRGLFFSSAKQQGTPQSLVRRQLRVTHPVSPLAPGSQPHFLHDLFSVTLPRDQYLARRTGRAIRGRLFRHLSIFGVCAAFSVLLLLLLTWTFFRDRTVFASVDQGPCAATPVPQGAALQLVQAESCRQVVQGLVDQNRQRFAWSKLCSTVVAGWRGSYVEEKTEFQIECEAKTFKASNRLQEGAEAGTTVFWSADSCSDAVITVSMGCDRRCVERATGVGITVSPLSSLSISKRYKGQGGFLRFLQDFSGGSHTFTRGDFANSYAPAEWQQLDATLRLHGVDAIRVSLRPGVPPTLASLMSLLPTTKPPAAITK